jgi:hypothetical protein
MELLTRLELADIVGSPATLTRMIADGRLGPLSCRRVGKAEYWDAREVRAWIAAGKPSRGRWVFNREVR